MNALLDIANCATWPNEWLSQLFPADIGEPVELYWELDHPGTDNPLACQLRDGTVARIREGYTGCIAYHCCRPLRPESYLEQGLFVTSEERLRNHAEDYFGMIEGWAEAFERSMTARGAPHYVKDWYGGTVGLSFTPFNFYCQGSLFGGRMTEALGEEGKRRWAEVQAITRPTILVCQLPMDWIAGDRTEGDLLADYARELLRAFMSQSVFGEPYTSQRAIHVLADIPPELILEIRTAESAAAKNG